MAIEEGVRSISERGLIELAIHLEERDHLGAVWASSEYIAGEQRPNGKPDANCIAVYGMDFRDNCMDCGEPFVGRIQ